MGLFSKNKPAANEIDINDVFRKTYNRIAKWHNAVPDMEDSERNSSLQTLTHLIIQDIGEKFGEILGVSVNLGVSMTPEMRKQVDQIKKEEGLITGNENMKKMFDSKSEKKDLPPLTFEKDYYL